MRAALLLTGLLLALQAAPPAAAAQPAQAEALARSFAPDVERCLRDSGDAFGQAQACRAVRQKEHDLHAQGWCLRSVSGQSQWRKCASAASAPTQAAYNVCLSSHAKSVARSVGTDASAAAALVATCPQLSAWIKSCEAAGDSQATCATRSQVMAQNALLAGR